MTANASENATATATATVTVTVTVTVNGDGNESVNANASNGKENAKGTVHVVPYSLEDPRLALFLLHPIPATVALPSCHMATPPPAHHLSLHLLDQNGATPTPKMFRQATTGNANGNASENMNSTGSARCDGEPLKEQVVLLTCRPRNMLVLLVVTCDMQSVVRPLACLASHRAALESRILLPCHLEGVLHLVLLAVQALPEGYASRVLMCLSLLWAPKARLGTLPTLALTMILEPLP